MIPSGADTVSYFKQCLQVWPEKQAPWLFAPPPRRHISILVQSVKPTHFGKRAPRPSIALDYTSARDCISSDWNLVTRKPLHSTNISMASQKISSIWHYRILNIVSMSKHVCPDDTLLSTMQAAVTASHRYQFRTECFKFQPNTLESFPISLGLKRLSRKHCSSENDLILNCCYEWNANEELWRIMFLVSFCACLSWRQSAKDGWGFSDVLCKTCIVKKRPKVKAPGSDWVVGSAYHKGQGP